VVLTIIKFFLPFCRAAAVQVLDKAGKCGTDHSFRD
jgi:hypothetical protein